MRPRGARTLKRTVAGVGVGALTFAGAGLLAALPASATTGFHFDRIKGQAPNNDRYGTSAQIAEKTFPNGVNTIIVANGESGHFPDSLTGNFLAGSYKAGNSTGNAPVLETRTNKIPSVIQGAITKLKPQKAYIIGGQGVVSSSVANDLQGQGINVTRLGGSDRFDTMQDVDESSNTMVGSLNGKKTAIVADGLHFADALAGGPIAYNNHFPVVLVRPHALVSQAKDVLQKLGIQQVVIAGGYDVVGKDVEASINNDLHISTVFRANGANRSGTSAKLADFALGSLGFKNDHLDVATGQPSLDGVDALSAAPHTAVQDAVPLLITKNRHQPDQVNAYAKAHCSTLTDGDIFGGTGAVNDAAEAEMTTAAQSCAANVGHTIKLSNDKVQPGGSLTGTIANPGTVKSLSVSGCQGTFDNSDLTVDSSGNFTIKFPASTPTGDCSLTFTVTDNSGKTSTQTIDVTVSAAQPSGPHAITLDTMSVPQGGKITGTIANPGTVASVTVDGCGLNSQNVGVNGNGMFAFFVPGNQGAGQCTLKFTVEDTNGTVTTQSFPITVTKNKAANTAGPDLTSATVNASNNTVTYTFDEAVASINQSPDCAAGANGSGCGYFHLYNGATGASYAPSNTHASGDTVIAQYSASQVGEGTVATVDRNAVSDSVGNANPINDAPVQPATKKAGTSNEPDLVSVNNERTVGGQPVFDFTFDQPVYVGGIHPDSMDFFVVDTADNSYRGTNINSVSADSKTVSVEFATLANNNVSPGQVVRGSAFSTGTSAGNSYRNPQGPFGLNGPGDGHAAVVKSSTDAVGNPLETAINTSANAPAAAKANATGQTDGPDLTKVQVVNATTIRYTFDTSVSPGFGTPKNPAAFHLYGYTGNEVSSGNVTGVNGNADAVDVTFSAGQVSNAVGASVSDQAVQAANGNLLLNQEASLPLTTRGFASGRTINPDLVKVTATIDPFNNTIVTYYFDQDVPDTVEYHNRNHYYLYDASDTQSQPTSPGVVANTATSHTVTFKNGFSTAQVRAAVQGSVDYNGADHPKTVFPVSPEGGAPITKG